MTIIRDKIIETPSQPDAGLTPATATGTKTTAKPGHAIRDGEWLEPTPELARQGETKDAGGAKQVSRLAPAKSGLGGTGVWRGSVEAKLKKNASTPSSDVAALLASYGIDASMARPRERILQWAVGLQEKLSGQSDPLALVDRLLEVDARRNLFMLEGAFRLYKKRYDDPIKEQLAAVKAVEDQIGAVDYALAMRDAGRGAGLPDRALAFLEAEVQGARQDLGALLADGWMPDADGRIPGIADLLETVTGLDWDGYADDRKYLRKELSRRFDKVAGADYDMDALEEGVHELRRQIRWFPIYFSALDGVAVLDDTRNPIPEYEPLLRDPIADSKYAKLPVSNEEPNPFRISKSLYLANTKQIGELGDLKDDGQVIEGLAHALEQSGVANSSQEARALALEHLGKTEADLHHIHERGAAIYTEIKRTGLLEHLRAEIRAG